MFHVKHPQDETIAAVATPMGTGGVGVIRVSGAGVKAVLGHLFVSSNGAEFESHKMLHGWLIDPVSGAKVDEIMACYMQGPKSYTGEDVVEFYCHGGLAVLQKALNLSLCSGARMAQKGEFTKRAFLNGKIDLAQAEAVLDLVKAQTREGAGLAVRQLEGRLSRIVISTRIRLLGMMAELEARIDFPEDLPSLNYNAFIKRLQPFIKEIDKLLASSVSGRIYREGLPMAIIGKPNVGKSSLLNALLGEERAIVTEIPGTTRDAIEETLSVQGMPLRIIDTAGIRHPRDKAEEFGVDRAEKELDAAELALIVIDASEGLDGLDRMVLNRATGKPGIVVLNKVDLGTKASLAEVDALSKGMTAFKTSALRRKGIEELKFGILELIKAGFNLPGEDAITINVRHRECLLKAKEGLERSLASCRKGLPVDFITIDLKDAILALGEVTGELVSEEVVNTIFEHFCVGK